MHFKYSSVYMSNPNSLTILSPHPSAPKHKFNLCVNLFLFCNNFLPIVFFLDSAYEGCPVISLYLKWIASQSRPCSTGDAAECHAAAWMGGTMDTCM